MKFARNDPPQAARSSSTIPMVAAGAGAQPQPQGQQDAARQPPDPAAARRAWLAAVSGLGEEARWCARASRLGPHEKLFSGPQKHSLPVKLGAPYMPIDRLKIPAYSLF